MTDEALVWLGVILLGLWTCGRHVTHEPQDSGSPGGVARPVVE